MVGPEGRFSIDVACEVEGFSVDAKRVMDLAAHVLSSEGLPTNTELSIVFVDEETIAALNERFRGKKGPTDVLSFSIDHPLSAPAAASDSLERAPERAEEEPPLLLGDVIICPSYAKKNAQASGGDLDSELDLLLVHGILHLLGFDHEEEDEAEVMEERERQLLSSFYSKSPN